MGYLYLFTAVNKAGNNKYKGSFHVVNLSYRLSVTATMTSELIRSSTEPDKERQRHLLGNTTPDIVTAVHATFQEVFEVTVGVSTMTRVKGAANLPWVAR